MSETVFGALTLWLALLVLSGCADSSGMKDPERTEGTASEVDALVDGWRWRNRVLLIWSESEQALATQSDRVLAHWSAWEERNLLLVLVEPEGILVVRRFEDGGPVGPTLGPAAARDLARRLDLGPGKVTAAVLVGKDGGVKRRYAGVVDVEGVLSLIDSMPMRIREMRRES